MIAQSIDVVLFVDDLPVGGQLNATLNRSVASIDITNKIDGEWAEHIGGVKTWNIQCSGLYVLNESALNKLEEAFLNNKEITIKLNVNGVEYHGNALIIDYPLTAIYNSQFKYILKLLGTGALNN